MFLTTDSVPVQDRAETIRDAIWRSVARLEIDHARPDEIRVAAKIADLDVITVCVLSTTPVATRRTAALARDDAPPQLFLQLQVAGTALVEQAGRRALLVPGQFTFIATRTPYTVVHESRGQRIHIRVPLGALGVPDRTVSDLLAVAFGRDRPLSGLIVPYVRRLAVDVDDLDARPGVAAEVGRSTLQLVRSLVAAQADGLPATSRREVANDGLEARIREYVRQRLRDPQLSAAQIARAHSISVRYLYKILARSGISLGDWIREQRLELCRRELESPGPEPKTIAAVAHRAGLGDLTHFARSFKKAYGMSPREYRAAAQAEPARGR